MRRNSQNEREYQENKNYYKPRLKSKNNYYTLTSCVGTMGPDQLRDALTSGC